MLSPHVQLAQGFYLLVAAELIAVLGVDLYTVTQVRTHSQSPRTSAFRARAVLISTPCPVHTHSLPIGAGGSRRSGQCRRDKLFSRGWSIGGGLQIARD